MSKHCLFWEKKIKFSPFSLLFILGLRGMSCFEAEMTGFITKFLVENQKCSLPVALFRLSIGSQEWCFLKSILTGQTLLGEGALSLTPWDSNNNFLWISYSSSFLIEGFPHGQAASKPLLAWEHILNTKDIFLQYL